MKGNSVNNYDFFKVIITIGSSYCDCLPWSSKSHWHKKIFNYNRSNIATYIGILFCGHCCKIFLSNVYSYVCQFQVVVVYHCIACTEHTTTL